MVFASKLAPTGFRPNELFGFMSKPLKAVPKFANEEAEQAFWETHDSTEYVDWTKAQRVVLLNLKPTTKTISIVDQVLAQEKLHSH